MNLSFLKLWVLSTTLMNRSTCQPLINRETLDCEVALVETLVALVAVVVAAEEEGVDVSAVSNCCD